MKEELIELSSNENIKLYYQSYFSFSFFKLKCVFKAIKK